MSPELDLEKLLSDLGRARLDFVVIGSSALAIQGWQVTPGDLDLLIKPDRVEAICAALGVKPEHGQWVTDGGARRLECMTQHGPVDLYVDVSGPLSYEVVLREAADVSVGSQAVRAGSLEHVQNMRAAVGRSALPDDAIRPVAGGDRPCVVAIDGPAGAGKSTVTRALAKAIDFTYLDTGAMYRCVTLAVFDHQIDTDDPEQVASIAASIEITFEHDQVFLDGRDVTAAIRTSQVTAATPHIASYPEVRRAMVRQQRQLFESGGYVAEGRDITTVVAPDAPLKVFLTASSEERARRRSAETGEPLEKVLRNIEERDRLDSGRELSALRVAEDAVVVDSTDRSVEDVVEEIVALARERGLVRQ